MNAVFGPISGARYRCRGGARIEAPRESNERRAGMSSSRPIAAAVAGLAIAL
jgi:hypothetical protein